jgi:hypothetical protein
VKFTYLELPDGLAFLTAQIAGHEVTRSGFEPVSGGRGGMAWFPVLAPEKPKKNLNGNFRPSGCG